MLGNQIIHIKQFFHITSQAVETGDRDLEMVATHMEPLFITLLGFV
jgi:hypothetical protein